jgi:hypothetical protein
MEVLIKPAMINEASKPFNLYNGSKIGINIRTHIAYAKEDGTNSSCKKDLR